MVWQDFVFLAVNFILALVLIPTLRDEEASIPIWTSVPTTLILYLYFGTFLSMDLQLSALGAALTAVIWTFIAIYRRPE